MYQMLHAVRLSGDKLHENCINKFIKIILRLFQNSERTYLKYQSLSRRENFKHLKEKATIVSLESYYCLIVKKNYQFL